AAVGAAIDAVARLVGRRIGPSEAHGAGISPGYGEVRRRQGQRLDWRARRVSRGRARCGRGRVALVRQEGIGVGRVGAHGVVVVGGDDAEVGDAGDTAAVAGAVDVIADG